MTMNPSKYLVYRAGSDQSAAAYGQLAVDPAALHYAIGMASEYMELRVAIDFGTVDDVLEEIGDLLWFQFGLISIGYWLEFDERKALQTLDEEPPHSASLAEAVNEIVSAVKAHQYYRRNMARGVMASHHRQVLRHLRHLVRDLTAGEQDLEDVMASNIAKLRKRYPRGFSAVDANLRADKAGE